MEPLRSHLDDPCPVDGDFLRLRGRSGDKSVLLAVTGAGKTNAAMATHGCLEDPEIRLVLQIGCAGAYPQAGVAIGDVVIADREILADEGAITQEGFLDLRELGLPAGRAPGGEPLFNEVPVDLPTGDLARLAGGLDFRVWFGPVATVSSCSGSDERAGELYRRWRPLAEAMEGAAAALAALRRRRPFTEVRGISNLAGRRDREFWEIDRACRNAARVVSRILRRPEVGLGHG